MKWCTARIRCREASCPSADFRPRPPKNSPRNRALPFDPPSDIQGQSRGEVFVSPPTARPINVLVVIPARYGSTRFPGKPLAKTTGKFLIQHVVEQAQQC